jgi:hypothetical protein
MAAAEAHAGGRRALVRRRVDRREPGWQRGWRELQVVREMDLTGKANRAIFSFWHNPVWEEVVFRGIPLTLLVLVRRRIPRAARVALWAYYLVPSVAFAEYHVPGHGPSRIVDTFILSLVFEWMALRYTFFAPLVLHYIFDAFMVLSIGRMPNIPRNEVVWLADHFTALNSTWSIAMLLWLVAIPVVLGIRRYSQRRSAGRGEPTAVGTP